MKKILSVILVLAMILSMAACGSKTETPAATTETAAAEETKEVYKLRLATHYNTEHLGYASLERIKEALETKSNGQLEVTIYPSSQLGDYTLSFEELGSGTLDLALIPLPSQYDSRIEMNFIPYLINGYDGLENGFGKESYFWSKYTDVMADQNIKLLGIYAEGLIGFGFTSKPEGYEDADVRKNMKVRAPAIEVYNLVTEDMGYNATTIAYSDLYTAMQTGVCDGWIGGTPQLNYSDFRDVIKYYIPYNCFVENIGYLMSMDTYNKLPADLQALIEETFYGEALTSYKTAQQGDEDALKAMEEYGIEILPLTDEQLAAYRTNVMETTWPKLVKNIGQDILDGLIEANK